MVTSKKRTPLRSNRYIDHDYGDDLIEGGLGFWTARPLGSENTTHPWRPDFASQCHRVVKYLCCAYLSNFYFTGSCPIWWKKKVWYFPIPDAKANIDSSLWSSGGQSLTITLLAMKTFRNSYDFSTFKLRKHHLLFVCICFFLPYLKGFRLPPSDWRFLPSSGNIRKWHRSNCHDPSPPTKAHPWRLVAGPRGWCNGKKNDI